MPENVLITGGTGLVGKRLTELLSEKGYEVSYLTRNTSKTTQKGYFHWDIDKGTIQEGAIEKADHIVHLAGASVASERWSEPRKKEILESRTKSTALLRETLASKKHRVKSFVSASAIGYYGDSGDYLVQEETRPADDFLAQVCVKWEQAVDEVTTLGIRTVKIRIGVVLSDKGGALPQMTTPVKFFVGAPLGKGSQYMSWIHIDDLCRMFVKSIANPALEGVYNGVAPNPVTNDTLTHAIADATSRPVLPLNVPSFALKLVMGEMADFVLGGSRVSSEKIEKTGFNFQFRRVEEALQDLLNK